MAYKDAVSSPAADAFKLRPSPNRDMIQLHKGYHASRFQSVSKGKKLTDHDQDSLMACTNLLPEDLTYSEELR